MKSLFMKILLRSFVCFFILLVLFTSACLASSPDGFGGAKWGMSRSQVKKVIRQENLKFKSEYTSFIDATGDIKYGPEATITYMFNKNDELITVMFDLPRSANSYENLFHQLQLEYGSYVTTKEKPNLNEKMYYDTYGRWPREITHKWGRGPHPAIRLTFMEYYDNGQRQKSVSLTFNLENGRKRVKAVKKSPHIIAELPRKGLEKRLSDMYAKGGEKIKVSTITDRVRWILYGTATAKRTRNNLYKYLDVATTIPLDYRDYHLVHNQILHEVYEKYTHYEGSERRKDVFYRKLKQCFGTQEAADCVMWYCENWNLHSSWKPGDEY